MVLFYENIMEYAGDINHNIDIIHANFSWDILPPVIKSGVLENAPLRLRWF